MKNNSQTGDAKKIGKPKLQDYQSQKLSKQWVFWHMDGNDDGWNSLDESVKQVVNWTVFISSGRCMLMSTDLSIFQPIVDISF
uniref:Uncharacterized protein n=1 Tax=Ditylenchus dipsaci TaxID=166011 RepID=A0A915EAQ1_9BILA